MDAEFLCGVAAMLSEHFALRHTRPLPAGLAGGMLRFFRLAKFGGAIMDVQQHLFLGPLPEGVPPDTKRDEAMAAWKTMRTAADAIGCGPELLPVLHGAAARYVMDPADLTSEDRAILTAFFTALWRQGELQEKIRRNR